MRNKKVLTLVLKVFGGQKRCIMGDVQIEKNSDQCQVHCG